MAKPSRTENSMDLKTELLHLYPSLSSSYPLQYTPSAWYSKERAFEIAISQRVNTITYSPESTRRNYLPFIRSDVSIPPNSGIYYYEVTINSLKSNGNVIIGVATKEGCKNNVWNAYSLGYHRDGSFHHDTTSDPWGPGYGENDVVGCGVDFISKCLFFTCNGGFVGKVYEGKLPMTKVYPIIAMDTAGCQVTSNLGERPFVYAFQRHVLSERETYENELVSTMSKEFINTGMRDLVAGYLVHHGYIESARAFSRWNSLSESAVAPAKKLRNDDECVDADDNRQAAPPLPLRNGGTGNAVEAEDADVPLPGFSSMKHRRSLRTFCQNCKYGLVLNTLNALYPGVVERYPELILQLRCRQFVEMMRRHSIDSRETAVTGRLDSGCQQQAPVSSSSDSQLHRHHHDQQRSTCHHHHHHHQQQGGSRKRPCTGASVSASSIGCVYCGGGTSESGPTLATCDDAALVMNHPPGRKFMHSDAATANQASFGTLDSSAATSCDAMDIDSSLGMETPSAPIVAKATVLNQSVNSASTPSLLSHANNNSNGDFFNGNGKYEDAEDDDDGFGIEPPAKSSSPSGPVPMDTGSSSSLLLPGMTVDETMGMMASSSTSSSPQELQQQQNRRLLRQIQFSRSLVDLYKNVKARCGGVLSMDTEQLLHQSVGLIAYPSPLSPECPLRSLLDPECCDSIASLINSAILTEEHKLPAQSRIEKALCRLQQCFNSSEGDMSNQSLGRFLLYHLSPTDEMLLRQSSRQNQTDAAAAAEPKPEDVGDGDIISTGEALQSPVEKPRFSRRRSRLAASNGSGHHDLSLSSNGGGRLSPPKRPSQRGNHRYTPILASNGTRRDQHSSTSEEEEEDEEVMREEEDEEEEISVDDEDGGVQLHHHAELEDEDEFGEDDVESLGDEDEEEEEDDEDEEEEEAAVELMTATMEEDGFDDYEEEEEEEIDMEEAEEAEEDEVHGRGGAMFSRQYLAPSQEGPSRMTRRQQQEEVAEATPESSGGGGGVGSGGSSSSRRRRGARGRR